LSTRANNTPPLTLGDLVEFRNGISFSGEQKGRGIPIVGVGDFVNPVLTSVRSLERVDVGDELPEAAFIHAQDLLFVRSNGSRDLVGRALLVQSVEEPTTHAGFTIRARPHEPDEWSEFLWHYFQSGMPLQLMRRFNGGTNITNLNQDLLAGLPVPDLDASTRHRVCDMLRQWDRASVLLDRLIDAKGRLRDGLAQALLTGRRRLPAFAGREWREARIGEVTHELTRRNGVALGADRVMAVNKTHGMIPMRERTIADDLDRYKVVPPGAFAYNPMRINIGSITRSHFEHETLVSPDYVVFEADGCDPRYLDWLRRTSLWRRHMAIAGNGGVRVRIYYDDLALMKVQLPDADEQSAIADILDAATREIDALARLRGAVAKQKRGLMQQLLTGRLRVPEVDDA